MIIHSNKLNDITKKYYLGECTLFDIGLEYFNHKLYSAALSYFISYFQKVNNDKVKSKCLSYSAECILNEIRYESTGYQQYIANNFAEYAFVLNNENIQALKVLIKLNEFDNLYEANRNKFNKKNNIKYFEYIHNNLMSKLSNSEIIPFLYKLLEYHDFSNVIKSNEYYDGLIEELKRRNLLISSKDQYNIDKLVTIILSHKQKLNDKDIILYSKYNCFKEIHDEIFKLIGNEHINFFEENDDHYNYSLSFLLEKQQSANGLLVNEYSFNSTYNAPKIRNCQYIRTIDIGDYDGIVSNVEIWWGYCNLLIYDITNTEHLNAIKFNIRKIKVIVSKVLSENLLEYYDIYKNINDYYILTRKDAS